jgi:hypothetical protein
MMWRRIAVAVVAVGLQAAYLIQGAHAQSIECDAFLRDPDGSWTVMRKTYIPSANVKVEEGAVFRPGGSFLGDDLAARLDKACPNAPMAAPAPTPAPVQTTRGQVPLSTYADSNGNIDVRRFSCATLDDASAEEAELLLSWYSGFAKKRGFNLARLRDAIRNVADYCKANRDKNLVQAMDLGLK